MDKFEEGWLVGGREFIVDLRRRISQRLPRREYVISPIECWSATQ